LDTQETTPKQDKQVTIEVPEDRLAEFYAFYSRFLAVGASRRRGGRGHGPGGHHRGGHHRGGRHGGERRCGGPEAASTAAASARQDATSAPAVPTTDTEPVA